MAHPVIPSTDPRAPYGRDENDEPFVPMRPDQVIAEDLLTKPYLAPGKCPHNNDPDNCLLCGTKDVAVMPNSPERPDARWVQLKEALDSVFKSNRPKRLRGMETAMRGRLESRTSQQSPQTETQDKTQIKITSYREVLLMYKQHVVALFDKVIGAEERVVDIKILMDKSALEDSISKLKENIKEVEEEIKTRSAAWQKIHRRDDPLSKKDREWWKRDGKRRLKQLQTELKEKRQQFRNWETDDRNYTTVKKLQKVEVMFGEKFNDSMIIAPVETKYVPDKKKFVGGVETHETTLLVKEEISPGVEYNLELYKSNTATASPGWVAWENYVILGAIRYRLIKPGREAIRKHPWLRAYNLKP